MEESNGSAFLPLLAVLGRLGLKISWCPIRVGEADMDTKIGLCKLALDHVLEEEASLGVAWSLFVLITFPVVRKMRAQGLARFVTFACGRTVWRGLKFSCATSTLAVTSRVMGQTIA